jgi:hypothetical protein
MRVSLPFFHGLAAATILRCIQGKSLFYKGHLGTVEATTNNDTFSAQGGFYASALDTLKVFLVQSLGASGDEDLQLDEASAEDIIDENGDMHLRYLHYIDGLRVEGAAMMMHIRANGSVYAVNGEYSPTSDYAAQTTLDCVDAIGIALVELDIEKGDFLSSCDVAAVNGRDGLFHKAYKALIGHSQDGGRQKSLVYASMTTGEPLALHPQVFGAHSLIMRDCQNTLYYCEIVTYRSRNQAARDAVLHATTTLDFFLETFGRNSVDGKGATITLNVNYDNRANNAYYADLGVWYGSGDGSKFTYFSKGLDVTAHEITHGVTYYTSSLIYENDSGAINEAMSDIIGATVERIMGNKSIRNVWIMGEDITLSGTGVRNMVCIFCRISKARVTIAAKPAADSQALFSLIRRIRQNLRMPIGTQIGIRARLIAGESTSTQVSSFGPWWPRTFGAFLLSPS